MSWRNTESREYPLQRSIAEAIRLVCARGAETSDSAILVGDAVGTVEWANLGWMRITGIPVDEILRKPIGHFLDGAGIPLEFIDFAGQTFIEGRRCVIEFPFEAKGQSALHIRLEIEPIRNSSNELVGFIATATAVTDECNADPAACPTQKRRDSSKAESIFTAARPPLRNTKRETRHSFTSVFNCVQEAYDSAVKLAGPQTQFDFAFSPDLPGVRQSPQELTKIIRLLCESAILGIGQDWGDISIASALSPITGGYISPVYPIITRSKKWISRSSLLIEIHDSGQTLDRETLTRLQAKSHEPKCSFRSRSRRETRLSLAVEACDAIGLQLKIDSTPGCGTQALLSIPIGQDTPVPPNPQ